jgi:hypothetical protein
MGTGSFPGVKSLGHGIDHPQIMAFMTDLDNINLTKIKEYSNQAVIVAEVHETHCGV